MAENTVTAIVERVKPIAAQLETVTVPDPPDIGVPRPSWHPSSDGSELRQVIGLTLLKGIHTELGKRGK